MVFSYDLYFAFTLVSVQLLRTIVFIVVDGWIALLLALALEHLYYCVVFSFLTSLLSWLLFYSFSCLPLSLAPFSFFLVWAMYTTT